MEDCLKYDYILLYNIMLFKFQMEMEKDETKKNTKTGHFFLNYSARRFGLCWCKFKK